MKIIEYQDKYLEDVKKPTCRTRRIYNQNRQR